MLIFSYGTLQMEKVQHALFGRTIAMRDDVLLGWRSVALPIQDPDALDYSGLSVHQALVAAEPDAAIPGKTLEIEESDWPALDAYEGDLYTRIQVTLASGNAAWVYVKA